MIVKISLIWHWGAFLTPIPRWAWTSVPNASSCLRQAGRLGQGAIGLRLCGSHFRAEDLEEDCEVEKTFRWEWQRNVDECSRYGDHHFWCGSREVAGRGKIDASLVASVVLKGSNLVWDCASGPGYQSNDSGDHHQAIDPSDGGVTQARSIVVTV
jgi:hypothetical protein